MGAASGSATGSGEAAATDVAAVNEVAADEFEEEEDASGTMESVS
jgi:hypothetical protein